MPPQPICAVGTLQNKGCSPHRTSYLEGGMDGKIGSQRCLLCTPNSPRPLEMAMFQWQGQLFQFQYLPFGLSPAPRIFINVTPPWLRQLGMKIVSYLESTQEEAQVQAELMVEIFQRLGFEINYTKSLLSPQQELEFLGVQVSTSPPAFSLPPHKLKSLETKATQLLKKSSSQASISVREIAQSIGTANAAAVAIPPAPLFYRSLQRTKHHFQKMEGGMNALVHLSESDREELNWWMHQANLWNYRSLLTPPHTLKITTDASMWGWGAACQEITTGGPWSLMETSYHINYLELLAAFLAVQCFTKNHPRPLTIYLHMDNTTAIAYLNHKVGTTSPPLCNLAKQAWEWCMSQNITLVANHLPGYLNTTADRESRTLQDRWDWQIHPNIFQRINQKWGPLSVDLFASRLTHQLPEYYSWRPDPYAKATDAFLQTWSGKMCYANPHAQDSLRNQSATSRGDPLVAPQSQPPPFQPQEVQLAVWPTSGDTAKQKSFRKKLQHCSWLHGETSPTNLTTHSFTSGSAGVLHGTEIPFQVL